MEKNQSTLERVFFGEKCKAKGILECFGGKILKKISKSLFGDILASIYTVQKIPLKHTIMLSFIENSKVEELLPQDNNFKINKIFRFMKL